MPPKKKSKTTHDVDASSSRSKLQPKTEPATKSKMATQTVARRDRHLRGKRGGLEEMPNMPLDVLIEIFGFLHPRDLLNLARTSRDFRAFLMSRNALAFWKEARHQFEGLPDPPSHLSEPAYANLLFFNHCHNCLKTGASVTILWRFFVRYCGACRTGLLEGNPYRAIWPMKEDLKSSVCDYNALGAMVLRTTVLPSDRNRHRQRWYHTPEVNALQEMWAGLKKASAKKRKQFIDERQAYVAECQKAAENLEAWHATVKEHEIAEKDALREERFEAVRDKLREEGWGDELDKMGQNDLDRLLNLNPVRRTTKLTEKGWTTMRDTVIGVMEQIRAKRLDAEYKTMVQSRIPFLREALYEYNQAQILKTKERVTYAGVADCALMPEVRAVIEDDSDNVTKESIIAKLADILPALTTKWMQDRESEYVAMALDALEGLQVAEPLDLAITTFACRHCSLHDRSRMRFPEVLEHPCFRKTPSEYGSDRYESAISLAWRYYSPPTDQQYHHGDKISIQRRLALAREIIEVCECNPSTATVAEMEASEVRLRCRVCATLSHQKIFTWDGALEHALESHTSFSWRPEAEQLSGYWECVPDEHAATARALETAYIEKPVAETDSTFHEERAFCAWCGQRGTVGEIKRHLRSYHDKAEVQLGNDFCLRKRERKCISMYAHFYAKLPDVSKANVVESGLGFFASF